MIDVGSVFPAEALNIFLGPLDYSVQCANNNPASPTAEQGTGRAARLGPLHLNEQISAGMLCVRNAGRGMPRADGTRDTGRCVRGNTQSHQQGDVGAKVDGLSKP